jgi:hypothetical protein
VLLKVLRDWKQFQVEDKLKTIAVPKDEWTLLHLCANLNHHLCL